MKTMKKILGVILILSVLIALNVSAMAYDITLYTGNNGKIGNDTSHIYPDSCDIGTDQITVTNEKYFAKGFAVAGQGSNTYNGTVEKGYMTRLNIDVSGNSIDDEDVDYVVVYGVEATKVAYTVSYVDSNGNELKTSDTYYGNDDDDVYIAAPFIDGYSVVSANGVAISGDYYAHIKLDSTVEKNITFAYAVVTPTVITNTVTNTTTGTTNVVNGDGTPVAADNANTAPGDEGTTGDNAEQPNETVIEEQQTPTAAPNEDNTVDLDGTDDTPTSNFFGNTDEEDANHIPVGARYAIAGVGVAAVGVGVFFLVKTLRKKVS